jgi:hypothetical protein
MLAHQPKVIDVGDSKVSVTQHFIIETTHEKAFK